MSAQPDLFVAPGEIEINLADRDAWHSIRNPKNPDEFLQWVVESYCGRYTITWSVPPGADAGSEIFLLWRRYPKNARGYRPTATLLGRFPSSVAARCAAAMHVGASP
jgi:hypothetical protein